MKIIKTIRLYPEHKSLYYEVDIYTTVYKMRSAIKKEMLDSDIDNDTEGYCSCSRTRKPPSYRKTRKLGKIYFYKDRLGVNTVSHEMCHAVNGYFAERGYGFIELTSRRASDLEEKFCYCLGAMIGDFYMKLTKINKAGYN